MKVASDTGLSMPVSALMIRAKAAAMLSFFRMTPPGTKYLRFAGSFQPQAEQNVIFRVLDDEVDGDQRCIANDIKKFASGQRTRCDHQKRAKRVSAYTQISIRCMATASNLRKSRLVLMNWLFKEKRRASEFIVLGCLAAAPIASMDCNPFAHSRRIS
jgi:hypothetical protein